MIADDRYRLIAELTIPATVGLYPHVIEQHFRDYLDYACRRLAPGVERIPDSLFSLAPSSFPADAAKPPQQPVTALGQPPLHQSAPLATSEHGFLGSVGTSEPEDLL